MEFPFEGEQSPFFVFVYKMRENLSLIEAGLVEIQDQLISLCQ